MNTDRSKLLDALFDGEENSAEIRKDKLEPNQITELIIKCSFKVGNTLGCRFLEKVYENSLAYELQKSGLEVKQQEEIIYINKAQCLKYLKATGLKICLLINFGNPQVEVKRIVL